MTEEQPLVEFHEDVLTEFDYHFSNTFSSELLPEKNLMYSVLIYSVIDYLSNNRKDNFKDARKWFFNKKNDPDYIYSFENICFVMKINMSNFKTKLKKLKIKKTKFSLDGKRII